MEASRATGNMGLSVPTKMATPPKSSPDITPPVSGPIATVADVQPGPTTEPRKRRAAAGAEAVRAGLRRLAVGGPQTQEDKAAVYEVSASDDELELEENLSDVQRWHKPDPITNAICDALKKNFVFKGITDEQLVEVVDRMMGVSYKSGAVVLQQGALPKEDDCMYYLQTGVLEVVISGAVDQSSSKTDGQEDKRVEGNAVRILQKPGWVFGDVALLFNSPRTASIVAKSNVTLWALDRKTFLKFVMKHAQGARALRFVRKVPLLKGLSDNELIRVAGRMPERTYQDKEALIRYGERGDEMFLIRYGRVRVLVPDPTGKTEGKEVAVLGRGQFVGERAVVNDRLRSADCVAQGQVQVVVMKKKDFMDLDNPLLSWMLDYDAVAAVLKSLPAFSKLKQEQMEHIIDEFDARQELYKGSPILRQGDLIDKLYVMKSGDVLLQKDGQSVPSTSFIREAGGFTFFGEGSLEAIERSPYSVVANSDIVQVLCLPRRNLDNFLGAVGASLQSKDDIVAALKKVKALQKVKEEDLAQIVDCFEPVRYNVGEVVVAARETCPPQIFMLKAGEVAVVKKEFPTTDNTEVDMRSASPFFSKKLRVGDIFNERVLTTITPVALEESLVSTAVGTVVIRVTVGDIEKVLGGSLSTLSLKSPTSSKRDLLPKQPAVLYKDLEFHRVIGTGQFGSVRVVQHHVTKEVYALKVMHKAPIVESKQIEHIVSERKILEEASDHPNCVKLIGAYQDKASLYLLQEWVPGGELFHHLDLEGAFDEPTAMFFAANVLLALEFLHSRGIVYRDLKPENLLLDVQGYIKMADFGFAKKVGDEKTFTICGTPDYQAPEVIMRRGTTKVADYWALGVLIFEMLVGDPPFKSLTGDPWDTFRRTLSGRFYVPNFISDTAADLIFKLLQVNPEKRLGAGKLGAEEIKKHRWFSRLDWAKLEARQIPAPIKPRVRSPLDTTNFDIFDSVVEAPPAVSQRRNEKMQTWELWEWIDE